MGYEQNKIDEYLNFIKSNLCNNNYNAQRAALKYRYNISSFKYYLKNGC